MIELTVYSCAIVAGSAMIGYGAPFGIGVLLFVWVHTVVDVAANMVFCP